MSTPIPHDELAKIHDELEKLAIVFMGQKLVTIQTAITAILAVKPYVKESS